MGHVIIWLAILALFNTVNSDWIEIPQVKETKNPDFSTFFITTSSTTLQTPFLPRTTTVRKSNAINRNNVVNVRFINKTNIPPQSFSSNKNNSVRKEAKKPFRVNPNHKSGGQYFAIEEPLDFEELPSERQEEEDGYSYAGFIPYLSQIQSTLIRNAHRGRGSKLNVLKNLKDHLLNEIQSRMGTLWGSKPENRQAREFKEDSHIDFPSNEGALMTIGFLTFAVFLIKLVLQVIEKISNKIEASETAGTTTTTFIGRKRRSDLDEETVKILNYIDQYRLK